MVDKVTAENKRIAKASAARGPAGAGIFELPTFAKGMTPQMLFDLAKDRGVITREEQADFTRRVGKDRRALQEFNELVAKAGYPKLKYQGIQPELLEAFRSQGAVPMKAENKNMRVNTAKVAKETFDEVNAMDAPRETKIQRFMDSFMSKVQNVSPQAAMNLARRFVMMFFGGPSMIGADIMSEQANQEAMSKIFGGTQSYAGGGIATMDDMIRPIGMAAGGPVPKNEFDAIMAEFDTPENKAGPGEPVGLEKIIAEKYAVDPRHTLPDNFPVDAKFLAREMGGDQGSGLMDEAATFEILNMKLKLLRAADSLAEMDRIQELSPYEILEEFTKMENKN